MRIEESAAWIVSRRTAREVQENVTEYDRSGGTKEILIGTSNRN